MLNLKSETWVKLRYGNKLYNKKLYQIRDAFPLPEISRFIHKKHIYTKINTPENIPNPLHLALPVSTLSHSPEIRRIKKHAEKWSEATSINQKRNAPLLYGNF